MIRNKLQNELTDKQKEFINFKSDITQAMLKQLEKALVSNDNGIGLPYWAEKDPATVKAFTFLMVQLGYGTVKATRNYSRFEFDTTKLDKKELMAHRVNKKLSKFLMREDTTVYPSNLVRSNGAIKETGLVRDGFAKVAKNSFKYDVGMMAKYRDAIKLTLIKSIRKAIEKGKIKDKFFADEANYNVVAEYCLGYYLQDYTYNLECNISDSRGRSIFKALKRIGNPVSNKDFRSLLVAPAQLMTRNDTDKLNDIYYFIAELLGSKATTEELKVLDGKDYYNNYTLPEVDLDTDDGRSELHEIIWLERLYTALDKLFMGKLPFIMLDIPIEVDASMSLAQIGGALLNSKLLLERTNVIGTNLSDPWFIEGVRRKAGKAYFTPSFYGSSQSATSLIAKAGLVVDKDELKEIRREANTGAFSLLRMFKDANIQNYTKHQPVIEIKLWNDTFNLEVNKFRSAGTKVVVTEAWDGKKYKHSFTHRPVMIPDYKRMKTFFQTLLFHNLDSQAIDNVAKILPVWMLTIHDAVITLPGNARKVRAEYANQLKLINNSRNEILEDFRNSIGATSIKADVAFMKLYKATEQAEDTVFNITAMK